VWVDERKKLLSCDGLFKTEDLSLLAIGVAGKPAIEQIKLYASFVKANLDKLV
jgi:hypothetical protein